MNGREGIKDPILLDAPVVSLSFSPDGKYIATSSGGLADMNLVNRAEKKIYVYRLDDTRTVQQVHQLDGHPKVVSVAAFFADGKRIFSASPFDGTLRVWSLADGKQEREIQAGASATKLVHLTEAKEPEFISSLAFWPWGRALTSHLDGSLKLWDMETGEMMRL